MSQEQLDEAVCYWTTCVAPAWFRGGPCEAHGRQEDAALIAAEEAWEDERSQE